MDHTDLSKLLTESYDKLIINNLITDLDHHSQEIINDDKTHLTDKEFISKVLHNIDKISSNEEVEKDLIDDKQNENINNNIQNESIKPDIPNITVDQAEINNTNTINADKEGILFDTLVFSGGGLRGFTYIGSLKALEEYDILKNIKTYAGSSIGALMAAVVAVGYTSGELHDFILHFDYKDVKDISLFNFIKNYGIDSGNRIQLFIRLLLKKKTEFDDLTFLELYEKTGRNLIITATCLNDRKLELLDYQKTPNLSIAKAIRMSISLPFVLQPVSHNDKMYIDGGLLNNFPIHIFDHNQKILGIEISDNKKLGKQYTIPINNFEEYLHSIWGCIYTELFRIRSQIDTTKNIQILTLVIDWMSPLQLTLNIDEKQQLYDMGYKKTKKFLDKSIIK
jgi:NTE family protein